MTRKTILVGSLAALVLIGAGFAVGALSTSGTKSAGPRPASAASDGSTAPTASLTLVPDVTGLHLSQAVQVLKTMGLNVGGLTARPNPWERGLVLSQGAAPGSRVPLGHEVPLVLSAGPSPPNAELGGHGRAFVGGTCELIWPPPSPACVGGPLMVPFEGG